MGWVSGLAGRCIRELGGKQVHILHKGNFSVLLGESEMITSSPWWILLSIPVHNFYQQEWELCSWVRSYVCGPGVMSRKSGVMFMDQEDVPPVAPVLLPLPWPNWFKGAGRVGYNVMQWYSQLSSYSLTEQKVFSTFQRTPEPLTHVEGTN